MPKKAPHPLPCWIDDMPGIKAITIADTTLFADYFNVPLLRDKPAETAIVKSAIVPGTTLQTGRK